MQGCVVPAAAAQETWSKELEDRSKRETLHDAVQIVRGDSGKWSDEPQVVHAPPIEKKPAKLPLDEWCDQLLEENVGVAEADDNWLVLRTRQLDDNDRVWVERIERKGSRFTVVAHQERGFPDATDPFDAGRAATGIGS